MSRLGLHPALHPRAVNVPTGPHRVLVIGLGRCLKNGRYVPWLPCCYPMRLRHCCPDAPRA
jgi:hypothetical protein